MRPAVAVEALTVTLGAFRLGPLDFAVAPGELLVILGPNGAGKSVTLEAIAGFHRPDAGRVLLAGRDVTRLPPERRRVGLVVQNFGLFPHLTVAQNVALARRSANAASVPPTGLPPPGDTAAWLDYFGVAPLADRTPEDLSPGEKQRVALARTLAAAPELFLFDEPFSALDSPTREQLREELLAFLRALALPAIFVTHDCNDALRLADRVVVLRAGALVQNAPAAEVFRKPANSFVASFLGVENILDARMIGMSDGLAMLAVGDQTLRAATAAPTP
jgi:ABC-type sulfate/molybdate transport systems ATPase subunit